MTLTTLSSKEFKTLFKWAFRRNRTIMIIFSVLLGLGLVLNLYAMAIDGYSYNDNAVEVTLVFYEVGAALFTFISALKTFSFLHNKRSVDMFGSLPADRNTMFVSHLLAGVSAVAIPFTAASVIIMGLATRSGDTFKAGLFVIFTSLIMIFAAYTFTALIAYCCGTVIDTAIVTIAANAIWVGVIALYYGIISEMIPGATFENILYSPVFSALAPYGFSVVDLIYYSESGAAAIIANIVWQLVFTAGIFVLTLYVSRRRRAETSQNGFAFDWLPMVIKAGASIVAGGFIGFIAAETAYSGYTNMYIFSFWYLVIGFVAFFVLHLIFARGLKGKFAPQAIVFGSTTAAVLILVFSMSYGLGIDTYVPNPDTVKEVVFEGCTFTEPEDIKLVTELHQLIADNIREAEGYPYYIGGESDYYTYTDAVYESELPADYDTGDSIYENYEYVNRCNFYFDYKKKLGFSTQRNYYIYPANDSSKKYDLKKMNEIIKKIYATEAYKMSLFPELFDEKLRENIVIEGGKVNFMQTYGDHSSVTLATAEIPENYEAFFDGFAEAYKKDLLADNSGNVDYLWESFEVGEHIEVNMEYRYIRSSLEDYHYFAPSREFIVKSSYKNTMAYLESCGITKKSALPYTPKSYGYDTMSSMNYLDFGYSGDSSSLMSLISEEIAPMWEYETLDKLGAEDFSAWHDEHYDDYLSELKGEAMTLYTKYYDDSAYYDPTYRNEYMEETGDTGDYFQLEDTILEELHTYSDKYIQDIIKKDDDTASDKKDSDIDKGTDTSTESKAETSSDTDTAEKTSATI